MTSKASRLPTILTLAAMLAGCASGLTPTNRPGGAWMAQQGPADPLPQCKVEIPAGFAPAAYVAPAAMRVDTARVAPGDRLRLHIAGDESTLTGVYVVGEDGTLRLPGIDPIVVSGITEMQLRTRIASALVAARIVQPVASAVDVRVIESAGVSVSVTGAVFDAGIVHIGERSGESRVGQREGATSGDSNQGRALTSALRSAGGVRPDADIAHIYLARGDRWTVLDFSAVLAGVDNVDALLAAGDRISVPSTGCFHADLVRPTTITVPGIRVFMSNLSRPAASNASAAISKDSTSLPYGTRLLQGMVALNCIGGSAMNDGRSAVLISRNPVNGQSIVIQRSVEDLVRHADRDDFDPYLMPGDALACYDSRAMNFSDAIVLVSQAAAGITPALIIKHTVIK